jgi:alkylation response protein AidB-like acyl-CoA dehydrogenase
MKMLETLEDIVSSVVNPAADAVDREGVFPRGAVDALGQAGLLGLVSAPEVGGLGGSLADASHVIKRLAQSCGSTAMVVAMHYSATAVIEKYGSLAVRRDIAAGRHLSTLAFSETGSRSHFWAPVSSAELLGDGVALAGMKSWVTSALEADSYVWSSRPVQAEGASTIWLVEAANPGLTRPKPFDGLGLRGNASAPITAIGARIPAEARLGGDGEGFAIMMETVLPIFSVLNASCSVGFMESALQRACAHVGQARLDHLGSSLADLPTLRAYLARARIRTDAVAALLQDTVGALTAGREDGMLRVLKIKAAAAEAALEVTDTAMRVCGGAAFRKDLAIERVFRDARAASVMAPTSDVLFDFIGKAVCGLPLF